MGLINKIGPKQMKQLSAFAGSATFFGASAFCGLLYFTEWKLLLQYMPLYNTKFADDEK